MTLCNTYLRVVRPAVILIPASFITDTCRQGEDPGEIIRIGKAPGIGHPLLVVCHSIIIQSGDGIIIRIAVILSYNEVKIIPVLRFIGLPHLGQ